MPTIPSYDNLTAAQIKSGGFEIIGNGPDGTANATDVELAKRYAILEETTQTGTTYTVQASDQATVIKMSNSAPKTVTIPSSSGFLLRCPILVRNEGTGILNFAVDSGVNFKAPSLTLELYETAVLVPQAGNVWDGYVPGSGGSSSLVTLNAPTGLGATVNSSTQITLNWADTNTSPNETNVRVRISTNGTSFSQYGSLLAPNTITLPVTGLTPGTLYYFRVENVGNGTSTQDSTYAQTTATTSSSGYLDSIDWLSYHDPELDIVTTVVGSDTLIDEIDDQKSIGISNTKLKQTTAGKRPKLIANAVNGHDVIEVEGGKWIKTTSYRSPGATKPFTTLFLAYFNNFTAQGSVGYLVGTGANQHDFGHWQGGSAQKPFIYSTTQLLGPNNLTAATPYVVCCVYYGDSTPDELYINDPSTPVVTGDAGGNTAAIPDVIAIGEPPEGGFAANGRVGRIYTYSGALTTAERTGAMNELKTYYGI